MNAQTTGFTPISPDAASAAPKLTDAELEKLLASNATFIVEGDEVSSDEPTIH